jgi:nuclear transport factor 2 (NTF2) superfamily protein
MACRFLVSYLKGDALTWWRSYANDNLEVFDELTLDVLIEALRE